MRQEYESLNVAEKRSWTTKNAVKFVHNHAPCSNMVQKASKKM